ncbi:hypothetical protein ATO8_08956 [Roseivivax marinus]|uniref:Chromosomal replication initiator DnaA n=1 Tax=Roseivivax marinus TaxID=1379903 RepID=W4HKS4_9RHOB|nr:chromosomal replication initiator protein DnaA [Roseivivax marinus]ETW13329.1 hypothetical protein ATO8_08956 [Roseivivax marinus]
MGHVERARQIPLELPVRPARGRGDFFVAEANAMAVGGIDTWRTWPGSKFAIVGPEASGKTHLAHVWARDSGARIVPATDLAGAEIPDLCDAPVCVEDVDAIAGEATGEAALFHLHNLVLSEGHALLLTAAAPPAQLGIALPDLASRLMGTPFARLGPPDDILLTAVLAKLFADRQIVPAPSLIPYLVPRMGRSFGMAQRLVAEIDRTSLARARPVSLRIARECLARLEAEDDDNGE